MKALIQGGVQQARRGLRHWWRPMLLWAVVVVASGIVAIQSDARERKALSDQFTLRTTIAGTFLARYVQDQQTLMRVRGEDLLAGPIVTAQQLKLVVSGLGFAGGGVFDGNGRLLMNAPYLPAFIGRDYSATLEHVRLAVQTNRSAVSQVLVSPALNTPVVALAVPYPTSAGRRIFTSVLRVDGNTLTNLLGNSVGLQTDAIYLIDRTEYVIAGSSALKAAIIPLSSLAPALPHALAHNARGSYTADHHSQYYASSSVGATGWRLVTAVGTAALYQSLASGETSTHLLVGALWMASLLAAIWYGVSARRRERVREVLVREREMARSSARLQQIIEVLPEGLILYDTSGERVGLNRAAVALLGANLLGQRIEQDYQAAWRVDGTPYTRDELPAVRSMRTGEVVLGEQMLLRNLATGHETPLLLSSAPLRADDGSIVGGMAVLQDISGLVELERQRDRMLSVVAHDLRNPLTSIAGMSQLLQLRAGRLEKPIRGRFVPSLQTIEMAARQMTTQIGDLLDYAQAQAGRKLELALESTDIVALVRRVVDQHRHSTDAHTLEVRAAEESIVVQVDPRRMERGIANLVVNAIKFSPGGGPIVVTVTRTAEPDGDWLHIDVADRGVGIPRAELPRIFDHYYRASNVASTIPGTGIGLAGVRYTIERHGGTVTVDSTEGVGTVVTLRVPLRDSAGQTDAQGGSLS